MKKLLFAIVAWFSILLTPVLAEVPAGAEATGCVLTGFKAVVNDEGEVLYWTIRNDLCPKLQDDKDDKLAEQERLE